MNGLEFIALSVQQTLKMHQATRIIRDNIFGARVGRRGALHFPHGGGNHWKFRGESAAEAAASFDIRHFDQFKSSHLGKELARRLFISEFPQAVATIVKGYFGGKASAQIGHTQFVYEKI